MERLGAKTRFQADLMLGQMNASGPAALATAKDAEVPAPRPRLG